MTYFSLMKLVPAPELVWDQRPTDFQTQGNGQLYFEVVWGEYFSDKNLAWLPS